MKFPRSFHAITALGAALSAGFKRYIPIFANPAADSFFEPPSRRRRMLSGKPSILARIHAASEPQEVRNIVSETHSYENVSPGTIGKWYRAIAEKQFGDGFLDPVIENGRLKVNFHHAI
jgi:hypothetical protein